MEPFIAVKNVSFSYGNADDPSSKKIVDDLSFEIEKGSFVAVLGRNGSGKSTIAKLLNSVLFPDSGSILIDGRDITADDFSDDDLLQLRKNIGMVFQNPDNQLVASVVEEDVAFGPENMGVEPGEIRRRVDEALAMTGMSEYALRSPSQLSGGQKQRVAIAGVIAMQPRCIIFDESTAMLDPSGRAEVMDTIRMLRDRYGITVILITHNMNEAIDADRVMVIDNGKIVLDGTPAEVFSEDVRLRAAGLDLPQPAQLCALLGIRGRDGKGGVLTEEDAADAIYQLVVNS